MAHINKQMISFFVTTSCNLDCSYCYTNKSESERRNQRLDLNFAEAAIDDFFARNSCRHIRFFGPGEPTREFELVKSVYEYAHTKAGKDLTAEIQTNGVFSRTIAAWLAEKVNIIWISSDGPPDVQDSYRITANKRPTSAIIAKNIRYLVENGRGMTGVRSTITEKTINRQKEIVEYFASLGVKYIWTDPLFPAVGERTDHQSFNYAVYARSFLEAREYAKKLGVFYGTFLACNFDEEAVYNCRACIPLPHLTTDGYVSACDMALFGNLRSSEQHMAPLIFGKWDATSKTITYYEDKIDNLRRRKAENMPGCKGCPVLLHCAGYCLGEVTNESGDMYGKKPAVCDTIAYLYRNMCGDLPKYDYFHP